MIKKQMYFLALLCLVTTVFTYADQSEADALGLKIFQVIQNRASTDEIAKYIQGGANLNIRHPILVMASLHGYPIKMFIDAGANPDQQDPTNGFNALMVAARDGKTKDVTTLLKAKANPDLQENGGRTAIMLATIQGQKNTVELLLNYGADLSIQDKQGKTVYDYAKDSPKIESMIAKYEKLQSPEHKKALREAAQKIISGTGPLQAQQTAGKTIQEYLR